jgi:hypothetical protein
VYVCVCCEDLDLVCCSWDIAVATLSACLYSQLGVLQVLQQMRNGCSTSLVFVLLLCRVYCGGLVRQDVSASQRLLNAGCA